MLINNISNKTYVNKNLNFGEGKAHLYSDFDQTFLPSSHDVYKNSNSQNSPELSRHFDNLRKFFNNTRQGLKFTLTSGRTLAEYETVAEMARERKFDMPLPDTFIAKNGSNEYLRNGTDEEFYKGGKFPFTFENTNKEKEAHIKQLTNWDGPIIKQKIIEILKSHDFEVIEAGTAWGVDDYGWRSLFSSFSDNFNPEAPNSYSPKVVSLRQDGDLKMHLLLPKDTDWPDVRGPIELIEKYKLMEDIRHKITHFLDENNIKYDFKSTEVFKDKESGGHPTWDIMPKFEYKEPLTKLYDVEQAVKKAIKENDLVIVAGDGSNDFDMLDPTRHLKDFIKKGNDEDLQRWDYKKGLPSFLLKDVIEQDNLLKQKLKDLPFVGIVVKRDDGKHDLDELVRLFGPDSEYKKIIVVKHDGILNGIKQAIQMYADKNLLYKEKLSSDLGGEILGIKCHSLVPPKAKGKTGWIITGSTIVVCGIGALLYKKPNSERNGI